jgi:hypothetical protein
MLDASTLERNIEYQPKKELWLQNMEGKKTGYTISHKSLPVISLRQKMVRHL